MSDFESLLEGLVPGMSESSGAPGVQSGPPPLPAALGLQDAHLLGAGGNGWVYRATDPVIGRDVAVKIARPDARASLLDEARLTARLAHPAVLPLHRVVEADGLTCAEYALAPAHTLQMWLANARVGEARPWPLSDRLRVLGVIGAALARAHALDVQHGDLHPGNILLSDAFEPTVIDWSGPQTGAGTLSGSPGYAAPEQLDGSGGGFPADVFALGALGVAMVSLRPLRPHREGENLAEFVHRWRARPTPVPDNVDPLLAEHLGRALAQRPEDRPTAATWLRGLQDVLSGTADRDRRQAEAARLADLAQGGLAQVHQLELAAVRERQALTGLQAKTPGWAPPPQKRALWSAEARVEQLEDDRVRAMERALAQASQAHTIDPEADAPRQILADLFWSELQRAELALDPAARRRAADRLEELKPHRYQALLDAPGSVTVRTDPAGARVELLAWDTSERVWRTVPVSEHGSPCTLSIPQGSWCLGVRAPGKASVRVPIRVSGLQEQRVDVDLFDRSVVGPEWIQVSAGTFVMGGDTVARLELPRCEPWVDTFFIGRTCVTSGEWLAFLHDLPDDEADAMVPGEMGLFGGTPSLWPRIDGRHRLPEGWPEDLPILGINIPMAERYCAWLSTRLGRTARLPTEEEWEKAARGVDGRAYPWGDAFDPTFCHMRMSRPGAPRPARVAQYPADESPYGVRDMAGGLREWTASIFDEGQHVIRGGTFGDEAIDCRVASRSGFRPELRFSYVGFRVAWSP